jgi:hypothetical protein
MTGAIGDRKGKKKKFCDREISAGPRRNTAEYQAIRRHFKGYGPLAFLIGR